jgi:hypothetical protein
MPRKYLILHLNSNGDILYATAIAKQLKTIDDPGCHITWAVASAFKSILLNNPHIDTLWEVPASNYQEIKDSVFRKTEAEVKQRFAIGEWDAVICPQLMYENMWRYDGTIRRAVLKAYKGKIPDVKPVLRLLEEEVVSVSVFAEKNGLKDFKQVVLFECSPLSGQSKVTPDFALQICKAYAQHTDIAFILSSNKKIQSSQANVFDGSALSFRQNAELTKYCSHFIGCSSGITWIATSDWAKQLPMLQLNNTGINPVGRDFEREGMDTSRLVELYEFDETKVITCLSLMLEGNMQEARSTYNQQIAPDVNFVEGILLYLLNHRHFSHAAAFVANNLRRSGYHPQLIRRLASLPFRLPSLLRKRKQAS